MPKRRLTLVATAAFAVFVIAIGVVWFLWLPSAVRSRVEDTAARRGLSATVGAVRVGLFEITLEDVELVNEGRPALRLIADEVDVDAGVYDLATGGSDAIRGVDARDVEVRANLDAPELPRVLRRLRGERSRSGGAAVERTIDVRDLRVVLRDRRGTLFDMVRARAALSSRQLRLVSGAIELAPDDPDGAIANEGALRLERGDDGWKVAFASLTGVQVRYRERAGDENPPLLSRIRSHATRLSGGGQSGARSPNRGQPAGVALISRVRDMLGTRLAPGAVLQLDDLSVRTGTGARGQTVLRDLEAQVRALQGGRFDLRGSGHPGRGGRLGWRLVVDPDELRGEGRVDFQRVPFVLFVPFMPSLPFHRAEEARISGELDIEGRSAERVHLAGEVRVEDLAVSSRRISPRAVRAGSLSFEGEADWHPTGRRLVIPRATLGMGDARASLTGSFEWPDDHYLIDVRATLPPTDCNVAVGAIPTDLLGELAAFTFTGQIGGRVRARVDSRDLDATELDIDVADACAFRTAPRMADVTRFEAPFTHRVLEPDSSMFQMETGPGTGAWTPLRDISPYLVHAVLAHEDGSFFAHRGFSTPSIRLALIRNLTAGRYVYGASTITMQLVKNVFLHREKTLARKVQEVLLTWWIESVMPKERILELYLNVIEYGPRVYGIRSAAEHYFGCEPAELGPAQSAYLAMILPNPKAFHDHWDGGEVPERFQRRVDRFLRTLGSRRRYTAEAVARGVSELATLRFARSGERLSPGVPPAGTAPLPFGASLDEAWDQELGPDDPEGEEAPPEAEEDFAQEDGSQW
jgi:hypothetical protein